MSRVLLVDGENRAVRSFLIQYSCDRSITTKAMREHMERSGWTQHPAWATDTEEHLTKAGAQLWLRFLFDLESQKKVSAEPKWIYPPVKPTKPDRYRTHDDENDLTYRQWDGKHWSQWWFGDTTDPISRYTKNVSAVQDVIWCENTK